MPGLTNIILNAPAGVPPTRYEQRLKEKM